MIEVAWLGRLGARARVVFPVLSLAAAGALLAGCAGSGGAARAAEGAGAVRGAGVPVALSRGRTISWDALLPTLCEAAGALAVEEAVLDDAVAQELVASGVTLPAGAAEAERELLARTLTAEAHASEGQAAQLIDAMCAKRGLGPTRFRAMLVRNASLRALVAPGCEATAEQVRGEVKLAASERCRVRILTVAFEREAAAMRQTLLAGPQDLASLSARFATLATEKSSDASAARGGLIEAMSAADEGVAPALREAAAALTPGSVSPVVVLGSRCALMLMEAKSPGEAITGEQARARVQLRLERLAMDAIAMRLLRDAGVRVLDPSLAWSWERVKE